MGIQISVLSTGRVFPGKGTGSPGKPQGYPCQLLNKGTYFIIWDYLNNKHIFVFPKPRLSSEYAILWYQKIWKYVPGSQRLRCIMSAVPKVFDMTSLSIWKLVDIGKKGEK